MKIAIIGYGKMGKEIEKILLQRNHAVVAKITSKDSLESVLKADVAIEFSNPNSAVKNIAFCLENKTPVVVGTTGWMDSFDEVTDLVKKNEGAMLYASNFSLGVNVFFEINKRLAELMNLVDDYEVSVQEIHHTEKLDAPSGTGISIAEGIIEQTDRLKNWENVLPNDLSNNASLSIESIREPNVPGTHVVSYRSEIDSLELKHVANNRVGFAQGAVIASEFLYDKKGVFTMNDVLKIKSK